MSDGRQGPDGHPPVEGSEPGAEGWLPPPRAAVALGPGGAVALAVAVAAGAWVARPVSLWAAVGVAGLAIGLRRPLLLVAAGALAASACGASAVAGLRPPPTGPASGAVTLVSDPEVAFGTVEVIGRLHGRHLLLRAEGPAGEVLRVRQAGERVEVEGRIGPLPTRSRWLRTRHVVAALHVRTARPGAAAAAPWRAANHLRRLLVDGTEPLGEAERALYLGIVLGDEREQTVEVTDDFRGSGLSHLLAVSGQNVAFLLAVAAPLLRRLDLVGRLVGVALLLGLFACLTRAEPSVLRAVAMAVVAAVAFARGRPTAPVQVLALAVAALVLVDPLLVRSIGFQLSVAATAGIVVIGPHLHAALPGPPALSLPLAVSAAAQVGVAPLLVTVFDGVPVASLPANLLAAPAAALVMTWGLPAGLVAGVLGPPWAGWLHAPTGLALAWLHGVARTASAVPLGELGGSHLLAVGVVLLAVVGVRWAPAAARWVRPAGAVVACVVLAAPGLALSRPPPASAPEPGLRVWRAGGAVVVRVAPGTGPTATLRGLRRAGVTRIDVLVVGPGSGSADEERAAGHRVRVDRTVRVGPGDGARDDGARPAAATPVVAGDLVVDPATGEVDRRGPAP